MEIMLDWMQNSWSDSFKLPCDRGNWRVLVYFAAWGTPGMLEEKANKLYKDISVNFLLSVTKKKKKKNSVEFRIKDLTLHFFFWILMGSGPACEHLDLFHGVLASSHQYRCCHGF